jgi:hypothetical protein
MKFLTVQLPPFSRHLIPLRSKYSSQNPVLKHPESQQNTHYEIRKCQNLRTHTWTRSQTRTNTVNPKTFFYKICFPQRQSYPSKTVLKPWLVFVKALRVVVDRCSQGEGGTIFNKRGSPLSQGQALDQAEKPSHHTSTHKHIRIHERTATLCAV